METDVCRLRSKVTSSQLLFIRTHLRKFQNEILIFP